MEAKDDSQDARQEQLADDETQEQPQPKLEHPLEGWILHGWNPQGLIGHMWLHAGILHLLGNMLFLWLFGNAVCAKVGNKWFPLMYLFFGFVAALAHIMFSGEPMLGASGAINGVVGMFLVFFPENEVNCIWILFFPYMRRISVSSYWMILLWFVFDIWGAMTGGGNTAYFAHLGGFAAGVVLAVFLLERKWVTMEDYEKSLLQLVGLHKTKGIDEQFGNYGTGWQSWQEEAAQDQTEAAASAAVPVDVTAQPPPAVEEPLNISGPSDVAESFAVAAGPVAPQPEAKVQPEFVKALCSCGKKVKFPSKYSGKTGQCPACKKPLKIPDVQAGAADELIPNSGDNELIRFSCKCGKKIKVPKKYSGKTGKCPQCHERVQIP
jgi:membrane associated rhomboid family serine protease